MERRFCAILTAFTVWWIAPALGHGPVPAATPADTVSPVSWSLLIEAGAVDARDSLAAFGVRADAGPEYDPQYDAPRPPSPPGTFVRAYFPHEGGDWPSMLGDKFASDFTSPQAPAWRMVVETNAGPGTVTLEWDTAEVGPLPDSYFLLMEDSAADSLIMLRETGSYAFAYDGPRVFLISAEFASTIVGLESGWNIVSVPRTANDSSASFLFPDRISPAYDFDSAYHPRDTMATGRGYWLKFPSHTYAVVTGLSIGTLEIPVRPGWNMIGVPSRAVAAPATGSVVTPFYGYAGGYHPADTLIPGMGYWVKVSGEGILSIGEGGPTGAAPDAGRQAVGAIPVRTETPDAGVSLMIRAPGDGEATLRLIPGGDGDRLDAYDLPPIPPSDAFDARFRGGSGAAFLPAGTETVREYEIEIQVAGNSILVSAPDGPCGVTLFAETGPDQWRAITGPSEPVVLTCDSGRNVFRIRAAAASGSPSGFALEANYPNPFNPSTLIRYLLPAAAEVTVLVTDIGGRTVYRSAPARQAAGLQEFRFEAGGPGLSSGVYYYTVTGVAVGSGMPFTGSGKMIYLK